ncbi:MAG: glycosyltransferase [Sphingomicrobium sp.]|nr:glycosyltransferase [Sphingomonadales bacterium]
MIDGSQQRQRIVVAICTYKRNEQLRILLKSLEVCADRIRDQAAVGIVIVDDTPAGEARGACEEFASSFELGLEYRICGHQNISLARNLALETAIPLADWIGMTDDDCDADPRWLEAFLDVAKRTRADAVTGAMARRAPPGSPAWLVEQPFLDVGISRGGDGAPASTAATNCSMIRSEWLRQHPDSRFKPELGVLGGEDMVFYRSARAEGLDIRFSSHGYVYEDQPSSRLTYRYQLFRFFWEGNSSYVTCVENGVPPWRMFVHGVGSLLRAMTRPLMRLARGQKPQLRYCLAEMGNGLGKMIGVFGVRIAHH